MSLRRRLERLRSPGARREAGPAEHPPVPGVPARVETRAEGAFLVHDQTFPLDHRHGRFRLDEALGASPGALALVARDAGLAGRGLERAVFLDTETTGLSGGAGTYVFLVGAGWFEDGAFRLRQLFMRDHREERAMLASLGDLLARFEVLVTFHGKSFDAPRIADRMRALHLEPRMPAGAHLDLCIVGRRLWRGKHADGRLQTLEARECGFFRTDDLPGAECPEAWFRYLRGDGELVGRVFEHNRDDILSLVALAARAARAGEGGEDDRDRLVRAALLVREGRGEEAEGALRALTDAPRAWIRRGALRELAVLLRRRGDRDGAAACWSDLRREDPADVTPLVEIAKHLEHGRREPAEALRVTEEAMRRARAASPPPSLLDELDHRRRRLLRKVDPAP